MAWRRGEVVSGAQAVQLTGKLLSQLVTPSRSSAVCRAVPVRMGNACELIPECPVSIPVLLIVVGEVIMQRPFLFLDANSVL